MANYPPHNLLPCRLGPACNETAVVSVIAPSGAIEWGCELHAGQELEDIDRARIMSVGNRDAARRLLGLPWNTHDSRPAL